MVCREETSFRGGRSSMCRVLHKVRSIVLPVFQSLETAGTYRIPSLDGVKWRDWRRDWRMISCAKSTLPSLTTSGSGFGVLVPDRCAARRDAPHPINISTISSSCLQAAFRQA